jgi:hypothetical protein
MKNKIISLKWILLFIGSFIVVHKFPLVFLDNKRSTFRWITLTSYIDVTYLLLIYVFKLPFWKKFSKTSLFWLFSIDQHIKQQIKINLTGAEVFGDSDSTQYAANLFGIPFG